MPQRKKLFVWCFRVQRLLKKMKLCQLKYDEYYYDQDGQLACFDTALTKQKDRESLFERIYWINSCYR